MAVTSFERTSRSTTRNAVSNVDCYHLLGLVRFVPKSSEEILIGQPVDSELDVGAAIIAGKEVKVDVYSGSSVLEPGSSTGTIKEVGKLLSPIAESEVGTIRCIGLNVKCGLSRAYEALANHRSMFNMQTKSKWPSLICQPSS